MTVAGAVPDQGRILTEYLDGPFKHLKSVWTFHDRPEGGSDVAFDVDFEFRNAILAGNQTAPNLQRRVQGVKEIAATFPGIAIIDTFYHKETPQDAAAKVEAVRPRQRS